MNKYLKNFLLRGLIFAGFGPVILAIVYAILEKTVDGFYVTGTQVCLGIVSTYILAFLQAGASVFNQIEEWSLPKALLCHFVTLYVAYTTCYLLNTWIPFKINVVLIYTAIFVVSYFIIWGIVYFVVKSTSQKMNGKL